MQPFIILPIYNIIKVRTRAKEYERKNENTKNTNKKRASYRALSMNDSAMLRYSGA